MKKNLKILTLIISLIVSFGAGFIGSLFTQDTVKSEWYQSLKPALTPPDYVFPIVWNILFLMIAISLYLSWINSDKNKKKNIILTFGLNLFFNALWSILFFGLRNPLLALVDIFLIIITLALMINISSKINKTSSYLLIPYLIWIIFATILNVLFVLNWL